MPKRFMNTLEGKKMRIISGKHGGRVLKTFEGTFIRPTSDRAKQALFNIFQLKIMGANFYDGFCGSGSVGIEALSRGAKVVFTDKSPESIKLTKANLKLINEDAEVYLQDCVSYLSKTTKKFDIIFLDPPYMLEDGVKALEMIDKRGLLASGGFVILEKDKVVNLQFENLLFDSSRKYGKAYFNIYRVK